MHVREKECEQYRIEKREKKISKKEDRNRESMPARENRLENEEGGSQERKHASKRE